MTGRSESNSVLSAVKDRVELRNKDITQDPHWSEVGRNVGCLETTETDQLTIHSFLGGEKIRRT